MTFSLIFTLFGKTGAVVGGGEVLQDSQVRETNLLKTWQQDPRHLGTDARFISREPGFFGHSPLETESLSESHRAADRAGNYLS